MEAVVNRSLMITSQLTLIPVTIVFFILLSQLILSKFPHLSPYSTVIIVTAVLLSLIISAVELIFILRRLNSEHDDDKTKEELLERQRKMILEVFGDTIDESDDHE